MGFLKSMVLGIVLCSAGVVLADETDTTWLYGAKMTLASTVTVFDTAASATLMLQEADTGDAYDGSYINFDYHFESTANAPFGPGYAGFRFVWDYGNTWFPQEAVTGCDTLVFAYKGLLPTHKATVVIGASGGCALPVVPFDIGTIKSSATWKRVAIPLPDSTIVNSIAVMGLCEIRFIINNDDGVTDLTSANGNFKVDNIALVKKTLTGVVRRNIVQKTENNGRYFTPGTNGMVELSIYSMKGEMLIDKKVNVSSGRIYSVREFALANSPLRSSQMRLIKIQGAGISVAGKM
jgi:hypothetical protein